MRIRCYAASMTACLILCAVPIFGAAVRNPTGSAANTLPANDDGSTGAVPLGFTVNFFGANSPTVFVNNNGNVTFTSALAQFTPNGLATGVGQPIIAPYFADVDTRGAGSGLVTYGTGTITDASLGWSNAPEFAVEWPAVGYYFEHTDKIATFELLLVSRADTGAGNFDIEFNYNTVQWETGDASGGVNGLGGTSAAVGYSNGLSGSSNVFFQLPGSLVNGALRFPGSKRRRGERSRTRHDTPARNRRCAVGSAPPAHADAVNAPTTPFAGPCGRRGLRKDPARRLRWPCSR